MEFNINGFIYIKLTDKGRAEHKKQHDEIYSALSNPPHYIAPEEDADGWSKWQAWDAMQTFGHLVRMGFDQPFETTVKLDV